MFAVAYASRSVYRSWRKRHNSRDPKDALESTSAAIDPNVDDEADVDIDSKTSLDSPTSESDSASSHAPSIPPRNPPRKHKSGMVHDNTAVGHRTKDDGLVHPSLRSGASGDSDAAVVTNATTCGSGMGTMYGLYDLDGLVSVGEYERLCGRRSVPKTKPTPGRFAIE